MTTLKKLRERESELRKRISGVESWWIRHGGKRETEKLNKLERRLAAIEEQIKPALPEITVEDGRVVLFRAAENEGTGICPFCGDVHFHGAGDGHRAGHCRTSGVSITLTDGTVLLQADGYIIRTREEHMNKYGPWMACNGKAYLLELVVGDMPEHITRHEFPGRRGLFIEITDVLRIHPELIDGLTKPGGATK